ncbi:5-methyltetrahydropteroyltriglutamate--homocysteine S-methyltransferase [Gulosibacter macacae]|uniref:5-methyltetrahydropteroyltriglutamate--homocysteine S-methyltransferase n=1 Tax=Gulosibacter macacae TaxID=2488791 RepID=A0A3P3VUM4_9MICO|nr:5-methyltetrahydropteroyltriglutamate--homocysteine S-methyltransferase [Gulosibacter macacae]RRJ86390.1 5-methyltetrahydropteroyltriglutamate--homocysteine S-methyltransferase [Gulosibacter macacae]
MTNFPLGTVLGYPRIGRNRELKRALERYWRGDLDRAGLDAVRGEVRAAAREALAEAGLGRTDSSIPEAASTYDHVLDTLVTVGALPARFADLTDGESDVDLDAAFVLARGDASHTALEMTKWFDTNYHYLVPEISATTTFRYANRSRADEAREAAAAGFTTRPTIVGPVTFLALAKAADDAEAGFSPLQRLDDLLPVYLEVLADLRAAGAEWVQLDESALVAETLDASPAELAEAAARAYAALAGASERPQLFVATSYAALPDAAYRALAGAGVEAIGFDLVNGVAPAAIAEFPAVQHVAGVINGHNIWRGDLEAALAKLEELRATGAKVSASTSTSLFHLPHTLDDEGALDAGLRSWLAFANEKAGQVVVLARALNEGRDEVAAELEAASAALAQRAEATGVRVPAVRERVASLTAADLARAPFAEREVAQEQALGLPALPTTTIGSFPQTGEIRRARQAFNKGEIDEAAYEGFLRDEIKRVVDLQLELGLDVLVHGEPERNDMVQYFAENLDGFATTANGWVQSYGSRCTRPSILWGDVSRPAPITVRWAEYAQSLASQPVKGMLTGPVTILAWSFVRDDQPLGDTAFQVGLALRDEVADLEAAGIQIIQVDEPALRELLPLERARHADYLKWSVDSFRLSTAVAKPETQIHTHLCYSEFGEIIEAIDGLDADVTSIEAARSRMEVVGDLEAHGYPRGIGPGVWDIHSPRVPSEAEVVELVEIAERSIPARHLWINPDCGLKTRGYDETVASLRHMVAAATQAREALSAKQ